MKKFAVLLLLLCFMAGCDEEVVVSDANETSIVFSAYGEETGVSVEIVTESPTIDFNNCATGTILLFNNTVDHNNCENLSFENGEENFVIDCNNGVLEAVGDVNMALTMVYDYISGLYAESHTKPVIFKERK